MQRKKDAGEDFLHPTFETEPADAARPIAHVKPIADVSMVKEGVTRVITRAELEAHNKAEEPWFAVNGQVYDGSVPCSASIRLIGAAAFLKGHPGGGESIQLVAGEDASEDFMAIHSSDAKLQLRDYHIGSLEGADEDRPVVKSDAPEPIEPVFLHKSKWKAAKLVRRPQWSLRLTHVGREDARLARLAPVPLRPPDARSGAWPALRSARLLPPAPQGVVAQRQIRVLGRLGAASASAGAIWLDRPLPGLHARLASRCQGIHRPAHQGLPAERQVRGRPHDHRL